jgi:DNA-binding MarR family transcriptional regulator
MNSVFFGLKRAYYATLRAPRKPLARISMTSARHHLLFAVDRYRGILQKQLRFCLGLAGATVSKMLKRLEELGFVTRQRPIEDRRQRIVLITTAGRRAISESYDVMCELTLEPAFGQSIDSNGDNARVGTSKPLHDFGACDDTPWVYVPGADGDWLALFNYDVNPEYDQEADRMEARLGLAFGPYRVWHAEDHWEE